MPKKKSERVHLVLRCSQRWSEARKRSIFSRWIDPTHKNKIEGSSSSDAAVAAKFEEAAAAALGAGVDALRDHEVHEAGAAAGGNEDLAAAGRCCSICGGGG